MTAQVLGPLSVEVNGTSIVPTASKPRQILSLFALNPKRVIPVPTLMQELWGTKPPPSAPATLQTYILHLRRQLDAAIDGGGPGAAKEVLTTRHGGYLLQVPAESVDVHQYQNKVADGHVAFEAGDDERAAQFFQQALALWTGPALVDVRHGPVLEIEVMRLEESRLNTVERRIDANLRLGRHSELVAELTELTARYPQHEKLHSQAMVALYRAGRQASALEIYRKLRIRMIEGLGVEPSLKVQRLHQAMLALDPRLDVVVGPSDRSTRDFDLV
jgi:DNA-binding SARP family transcriptional activator